jgi:EAL domain-containing protein (putative c-di-GMP-specific phosphodiesterase class I)
MPLKLSEKSEAAVSLPEMFLLHTAPVPEQQVLCDVLENDRIEIFLQPVIQFPLGRLHGYECLLRGRDENGAVVAPGRLLNEASRLGMLRELDSAARLAALNRMAEIDQHFFQFFINFMPEAIENLLKDLSPMTRAVTSLGLRPQQVAMEVVQSELVLDRAHLMRILNHFRKAEFKVALDDVGCDRTSVLALVELEPDYIKINKDLLQNAVEATSDANLLRELCESCRQHGIITVAKGIETLAQAKIALESGIRLLQGNFLAEPAEKPITRIEVAQIAQRVA